MNRAVFLALFLAACSGRNDLPAPTGISSQSAIRPQSDVIFPAGYEEWKAGFRARALSRGISPQVFDAMFAGTGINKDVLAKDRNQAEFKKSIWEYVDGAVREQRLQRGRQMAAQYSNLLGGIEARYGVDRGVILGVWGNETNFGARLGNIPVAESLATLAFDGRRRSFAEEQLMAALRIAQNGDAPANQMLGSWAGAMGQTQFIPTSYIAYAQDFDGDGHRNLWQVADGLASTANYLKQAGWVTGLPWGVEVITSLNSGSGSGADLQARGVRRADGGALPSANGRIFAPAGDSGPKFVVYKNFDVIKRYNNADSYALAVGHLGDRLTGKGAFVQDWPWGENQLRSSEVLQLQQLLVSKGYSIEKIDGVMGDETRGAISSYQAANGLQATGQPSRALLRYLQTH